MSKEKRKLTSDIHKLKKKGLGRKELDVMYKTPLELNQLIWNNPKPTKEIKESVGESQQYWDITYAKDYGKLSAPQVHKLAKCLEVNAKELFEIIKRDIEIQKQN